MFVNLLVVREGEKDSLIDATDCAFRQQPSTIFVTSRRRGISVTLTMSGLKIGRFVTVVR